MTFPGAAGPTVIPVPAPSGIGRPGPVSYTFDLADGRVHRPEHDAVGAVAAVHRPATTAKPRRRAVRLGHSTRTTGSTGRPRRGDLVRVHWYEGGAAFGAHALQIGEDAVESASTLLGVTETEPIDFYVYADQAAFYDALGPGTRENVGGQANADIRTMFALVTPDEIDDRWVDIVIPHELTHLVFDTAVEEPVPLPAALAQRRRRRVPEPGLRRRLQGHHRSRARAPGRSSRSTA